MKLIRKKKREIIDLPFKVGETYVTKMQTAEKFTITEIVMKKDKDKTNEIHILHGIWDKTPHLGVCPIFPERLIPHQIESGKVLDVCNCPHCNKEIEN